MKILVTGGTGMVGKYLQDKHFDLTSAKNEHFELEHSISQEGIFVSITSKLLSQKGHLKYLSFKNSKGRPMPFLINGATFFSI